MQFHSSRGAGSTLPEGPKSLKSHAYRLMVVGVAFCVFATLLAAAGLHAVGDTRLVILTIALPVFFGGGYLAQSGYFRARGLSVERAATRKLSKRLREGWLMNANVPCVAGGDIDIVVTDPAKHVFAIEVKSFAGLKVKRALFGHDEKLTYRDGRALSYDPVNQALRNAETINAVPVIWLPRATSGTGATKLRSGAILIQGSARRCMIELERISSKL